MVKKPIDERPLTQKLHSTHFLHKFKKIYQNFVFPKHQRYAHLAPEYLSDHASCIDTFR